MKRLSEEKIQRYLNNEMTAKEAEEVIAWFNTREGAKYLEEQYFTSSPNDDTTDCKAYEKLLKKINMKNKPSDS